MRIPTVEEINVYDSLDEQSAVKNFLGKSLSDAEALFKKNSLYYMGDMLWMGSKAFCYYVAAVISYLESDSSDGDSDAVNCFHGTLEHRLLYEREEIAPAFPILHAAVAYILDHWEKFAVDPGIYGDLNGDYTLLLEELPA